MDKIFLRDLRAEAIIGVWDWERQIRQPVSMDLELAADVRRAAAADRIEATLDYKAVAKRVVEYVGASEFQLVETLAEAIARLLIEEFGVGWLRLTLNKPGAIRGARDVGVVIERSREDY